MPAPISTIAVIASKPLAAWASHTSPPAAISRPALHSTAGGHQRVAWPASKGSTNSGADQAPINHPVVPAVLPSMPAKRMGSRTSNTT